MSKCASIVRGGISSGQIFLFLFILLFLPSIVSDQVWKQQTVLQLLQLVELPVLDCILTSPERVHPQTCKAPLANQDLVISNTCLERELSDTLPLPQSVLWFIPWGFCTLAWDLFVHVFHYTCSMFFHTFFFQVGWVAVSSSRLFGTLSRPADRGCRRTAKPAMWKCVFGGSQCRTYDKQEEAVVWYHCQILQWTRKISTHFRALPGYTYCSSEFTG